MTYPTLRSKAAVGEQFMEVMKEYQQRQEDDPNFDPSTRFYDLYDELTFIYEQANSHNKQNPSTL